MNNQPPFKKPTPLPPLKRATPLPATPTPLPPGMQQAHAPVPMLSLKRRKKYRLRRRVFSFKPEAGATAAFDDSLLKARIAQLEADLAVAKSTLAESEEKGLRSRSELENMRRRHQKEKDDMRKYAGEDLLRSIMSPLDHIELALASMDSAQDIAGLRQGIRMTFRELSSVLSQHGLEEIRPEGVPFDPNLHEAAATGNDPGKPDGCVLNVLRTGYALRGRVLRAALVMVNKVEAPKSDS